MNDAQRTAKAKAWALDVGETLAASIPGSFTFVLAIFEADKPDGALMLSPQQPADVVPILRQLADTIEARTHEVFTREETQQ